MKAVARAGWAPAFLLALASAAHAETAAPSASASAPSDTWAFEPPRDGFEPAALLDLRHLNEAVAGQSGFVRVDAEGDFVRGDGQPIRFWAVNSDVARHVPFVQRPLWKGPAPDLAYHARFLAKRGVNMVRQHRQISPDLEARPNAALTDINEAERDAIWRMVAAMRKEGIYTTLSPYWGLPMKFSARWGVAGGSEQSALGLLFFDPQLQAAYKQWLKKLLTEKNPHTGLTLAQDPSVAVIQLQNEDSLFFWSVNHIRGPQREALEQRFATFVRAKHGSVARALMVWRGRLSADDKPWAGRLALLDLGKLTQRPDASGLGRRLADQTEFYARTMHDFNRQMVDYLRGELGVKALINAGNWKTASAERLNDAERWSYTPGEVDAVNHYIGGLHQGKGDGKDSGWAIVSGDRFTSDSALLSPHQLPINLKQTHRRPMLVTESAWVLPNAHAAEGPFLVAAYSALTGVDGYYWFAASDDGWTPPQAANGYMPSQRKWTFATPEMLGGFPAAALAYRRGDIRRGTPMLLEHRVLNELWQRQSPLIHEESGFDPNRDTSDASAGAPAGGTTVSPDAFLVGPVQVRFGTEQAASRIGDTAAWADKNRVRANTGEIVLDRSLGVCTLDTPKAQGVAAHFSRAPEHRLSTLSLRSGNAFGALLAVSLDDQPLSSSQSVLLQYATQSRPRGWRQSPVTLTLDDGSQRPGWRIDSHGEAPWQVLQPQLEVTLLNPRLRRATALDMNGMPLKRVPVERKNGGLHLSFPASAMYVVLE